MKKRVRHLEKLLLAKEQNVLNLEEAIRLDANNRYVIFTDSEELKILLPDNVLILPNQFLKNEISASLKTIKPEDRNDIELWLLKNVMKAVVPDDIITISGDAIFLGGRRLKAEEIAQYRNEVNVLQKMRLPRILDETISENARLVMYKNAKDVNDIKFGKTVFYVQDLKEKICTLILKQALDEKMKGIVQSRRH